MSPAAFLQQELRAAGRAPGPCAGSPRAPLAREALRLQEQSEQLAQELREVSGNRASLRARLRDLRRYLHVLREGQRFTSLPVGLGGRRHGGVAPRPRFVPTALSLCSPSPQAPLGSPARPRALSEREPILDPSLHQHLDRKIK